jgi:MFS family permease
MLDLLRENQTYRRLLYGRIITNTGDSLYLIAGSWLVHELTGSAAYTGLAAALYLLPSALQFLTGPFADRVSLRRIFVSTQLFQGIAILSLPVAAWFDVLSYPLLLVVIPVLAMTNQFVYPAETAMLSQVVDEEQLVQANTLFSFSYRSIDTMTRAFSGIIIAIIGAIPLFVADAATFFLAAVVFSLVSYPDRETDDSSTGFDEKSIRTTMDEYFVDIRQGANYLRESLFKFIIAGSLVTNAAIGTSLALLPKFADNFGGPATYGFLLTSLSAGVLLGTVVATLADDFPFGRLTILGFIPGGVAWTAAILVNVPEIKYVLFGLAWVPIGAFGVYTHTLKQVGVPDEKIGRVSATYNSATVLTQPLGALFGGTLGELFGVSVVLTAAGAAFLIVATIFLVHTDLRRLPAAKETTPEQMHQRA